MRHSAKRLFSISLFLVFGCDGRKSSVSDDTSAVSDSGSVILDSGLPQDSGSPLDTAGPLPEDTGVGSTDTGTIEDTGSGDTGEPEEVDPCGELLGFTEWEAGTVYVGEGLVNMGGIGTCYDAKTGKELWQERLGGNYAASPVVAGGLVYIQNEAGQTVVIEPDQGRINMTWRAEVVCDKQVLDVEEVLIGADLGHHVREAA